ncbi:MAG: translation initiation factor IF-3 [Bacteroidetes bacterium]|nr:translation initiation factor IF-3 [Bacteroidota bacterium]
MEKKPGNRPPYPRRDFRREKEPEHRINGRINVAEIRLVGDNIEQGVYSTQEALRMAQEQELDLVEISPNATPPVCRIIDYKKFLYDQKKKQKEMKAKQVNVTVKEIRFGPNTDDHDFAFKLKHAIEFLKDGSKVRSWVFFKGRSIVFKDRGEILLLKFIQELSEYGVPEQMPKLEGKKMFVIINPKKK